MPVVSPISQQEWEARKEEIESMYLVEKKTLSQVKVAMGLRGFHASQGQYARQLRKWGLTKRHTAKDWDHIARVVKHRSRKGKASTVLIDGERVSSPKLKKEMGRIPLSHLLALARTPSPLDHISIHSPLGESYQAPWADSNSASMKIPEPAGVLTAANSPLSVPKALQTVAKAFQMILLNYHRSKREMGTIQSQLPMYFGSDMSPLPDKTASYNMPLSKELVRVPQGIAGMKAWEEGLEFTLSFDPISFAWMRNISVAIEMFISNINVPIEPLPHVLTKWIGKNAIETLIDAVDTLVHAHRLERPLGVGFMKIAHGESPHPEPLSSHIGEYYEIVYELIRLVHEKQLEIVKKDSELEEIETKIETKMQDLIRGEHELEIVMEAPEVEENDPESQDLYVDTIRLKAKLMEQNAKLRERTAKLREISLNVARLAIEYQTQKIHLILREVAYGRLREQKRFSVMQSQKYTTPGEKCSTIPLSSDYEDDWRVLAATFDDLDELEA